MSSRALRRAQKEREKAALRLKLQDGDATVEESEDDEPIGNSKQMNAFAMLNAVDNDGSAEDEEEDQEQHTSEEALPENTVDEPQPQEKTKRKKKKKKAKQKKAVSKEESASTGLMRDETPHGTQATGPDEIDLALLALSNKNGGQVAETRADMQIDPEVKELHELLAIDFQHLNSLNEMRRLFGREAIEERPDPADEAIAANRHNRSRVELTLGAALSGKFSPYGRGGPKLKTRRNIFMQPREDWPRATAGGLGMEIVEKAEDDTTEYRFMHNKDYKRTQHEFEICVDEMEVNSMITLLQMNPYHISTLLQVSEIAKQQHDSALAGDLLERALFSFGRAVHSSFAKNLAEGKATLDFRRPENREFYLTVWRYIQNLGSRGTWRTVYEWAKLLLSLNPEQDPYCMRLCIDQFAIRARQAQNFLDLSSNGVLTAEWDRLLNIQVSRALAHFQLKQPQESRAGLKKCITKFPFVFDELFRELNISRVPPSIWGTSRNMSEYWALHSGVYIARAKDLFNTPEITSLLVECAETTQPASASERLKDGMITRDEARYVLLLDNPALISLLPRFLTSRVGSSSDPVPPELQIIDENTLEPETDDSELHGNEVDLPGHEQGEEVPDPQNMSQRSRLRYILQRGVELFTRATRTQDARLLNQLDRAEFNYEEAQRVLEELENEESTDEESD